MTAEDRGIDGDGRGPVVGTFSERHELALELLTVGRHLARQGGMDLAAIAFDRARGAEYRARGADRSVAFGIEPPGVPTPEVAVTALAALVAEEDVRFLLVGATAYGTEVAARLAQRLGVGCASECLSLDAEGGALVVERRCFGRFVARQSITLTPAIATVASRRFEPPPDDGATGTAPAAAAVEVRELEAPPTRVRVVETRPHAISQAALRDADALVAVGRGLRRPEDLDVLRDLADAVGGVLVATRPLTDDLKWLPVDVKVGLSGQTVKPDLYLACGVSGQIEHVVGMRESRLVVAVNTDPEAPMMREADLCVVGDLYEVVPALARAIRRQRATLTSAGPPAPPLAERTGRPCPCGTPPASAARTSRSRSAAGRSGSTRSWRSGPATGSPRRGA